MIQCLNTDRLTKVLFNYQKAFAVADVREVLTIKKDTVAAHTSSQKRDIHTLHANLVIDQIACNTIKKNVVLFDDVLTTGAHYKACKQAIESCPNVEKVIGIFVARRSLYATALHEFSNLDI